MKTQKEKAKELVDYYFEEIGVNYSGYKILAKEFSVFFCNGVIENTKDDDIKWYYEGVIEEIKLIEEL